MEQLFIDGREVDLPLEPITRKIQIADISDISTRNSSYSYTVKLPRTQRNISIMNSIGMPGNTSDMPYRLVRADYLIDTLPIIYDGRVVVQSVDETININIIDGVIGFFELFGDMTLADISFDDDALIPSANTYKSGNKYIQFALADFGYLTAGYINELYTVNFIPQPLLNYRALLTRIYEVFNISDYQFIQPSALVDVDVYILPTQAVEFSEENIITVASAFGDIKIIDVVKDIFTLNGVIVHPTGASRASLNNDGGNYRATKLSNIFEGKGGEALNYTDKLIEVSSQSFEGDDAQKNYFVYGNFDESADNRSSIPLVGFEAYARGVLEVDNFNLPLSLNLVESSFDYQPLIYSSNSVSAPWGTRYDGIIGEIDLISYDGSVIEYKSISQRLVRISEYAGQNWRITIPQFGTINIVPEDTTRQLEVSPSMQGYIDNNFVEYKKVADRFKKIEVVLNLSLIDIYRLDFFKLIYFEQLGAYYYLNSVQYTHGTPSKCELIEIKK